MNAIDLFHQQWHVGMAASAINACATPFVNPCVPGGFTSSNPNFYVTVPFSGQTYNTFGHIVFKGSAASAESITDNWGPRVGIVWQFLRNTVLRAGYGILYDTITARSQWVQNTLLGADWPWTEGTSSLPFNSGNASGGSASLSPMATLIAQGITPSVANTPWALNQNGGFAYDPSYIDARSQQWHVDLERQLGNNMRVSVAYVGSKSDRLDWTGNANAARFASPLLNSPVQISPQGVSSCGPKGSATDTAGCESACYTAVDNLRLMPWAGPTITTPLPLVTPTTMRCKPNFKSACRTASSHLPPTPGRNVWGVSSGWFNVENGGTGGNGGTVTENYFDQSLSYGPCAFDVPQDVTLSADYELPFGHGKRYLTHGPFAWVLGNWESNLFFIGRSGQNFQVTNGGGDPAALSGSGGEINVVEGRAGHTRRHPQHLEHPSGIAVRRKVCFLKGTPGSRFFVVLTFRTRSTRRTGWRHLGA